MSNPKVKILRDENAKLIVALEEGDEKINELVNTVREQADAFNDFRRLFADMERLLAYYENSDTRRLQGRLNTRRKRGKISNNVIQRIKSRGDRRRVTRAHPKTERRLKPYTAEEKCRNCGSENMTYQRINSKQIVEAPT